MIKSKHKLIKEMVMVTYMAAIANIRYEIRIEVIAHRV